MNTIFTAAKSYTYINDPNFANPANQLNEWESFKDGGQANKYGFTLMCLKYILIYGYDQSGEK